MRLCILIAVAAVLTLPAFAQDVVPEPSGFRMDAYRSPVPATLSGARVVGVAEARSLWEAGSAFVDVLPAPPRPDDLPEDTIWRVPARDSIAGAVWLPNTGFGAVAPEVERYFDEGLADARGDGERPLVVFCMRECWMSWNAAKRAMAMGYSDVVWFPDGTDGWADADLPMQAVRPRAGFR